MKFRKFDHFLRNLDKKGKKRIWKRTVKFLTCVVVFVTTYALILPAITLESKAHCGESEHQHGDECYEIMKTLICKSEETEGHQHDETCFEKVRTLTCTNEDPEHEHSDSCYQEEEKLTCSKEEQPAHHHSDECYKEEKKLVCDRKEHEHEELCYSDPEADLETSKDWKKSIEKIELTGNWADDAVKIAQSQIGVKESKDNFEIDEKTDEKKGISRYGQWYGKPYSDWSAFFTAFCLYYSNMPDKDFPYIQDSVDKLVKELDKADYQLSNDFSEVQKGDLIFIRNENTNKEDTYSHVGLVESVNEKKNELNLILGDWNNKVERKNFSKSNSSLAGTIRLPENPELNTEENDSPERDESGRSEPSEDPEPEPDEEPKEDSVSETDLNSQTAAPKKVPARANAETDESNGENDGESISPLEFDSSTPHLNKNDHGLTIDYASNKTEYDPKTETLKTSLTLNFDIKNGTVNQNGEYVLDLDPSITVPGKLSEVHYFKYGDGTDNGGQYTFVKCDDGHYQLRMKIDEDLVKTSRDNKSNIKGFIT